MKVQEIMTRDVKTVRPDEDARSVYRKFSELGIHHIPVVEGGKTVGMLSTTDFRGVISNREKGAAITADMVFGGLSVRSLMTRDPITLDPEATVQAAASLMLQEDIHALPVVNDGVLVGIITVTDILSSVAKGRVQTDSPKGKPRS